MEASAASISDVDRAARSDERAVFTATSVFCMMVACAKQRRVRCSGIHNLQLVCKTYCKQGLANARE